MLHSIIYQLFLEEVKMKALHIKAEEQSIEVIEVANHDDIVRLIGFDSINSDEISAGGDHLFFDEECFLRGSKGRFQLDKLIPVSGNGIIIGAEKEGRVLKDMMSDISDLKSRIKYF